ncbi:MAG: hypothetical protein QM747_19130 [Nocardioides sp.]
MPARTLLASTALIAAVAAASVAAYVGIHDGGTFSPAAEPDSLSLHDAGAAADPSLAVTTISQAQFKNLTLGLNRGCATRDSITFCQAVLPSRSHNPTWEVYLDLGQPTDLSAGKMDVSIPDEGYTGAAVPDTSGAGPYVRLQWNSSSYDISYTTTTYTTITLGQTQYSFTCSVEEGPPQQTLPSICGFDDPPAS